MAKNTKDTETTEVEDVIDFEKLDLDNVIDETTTEETEETEEESTEEVEVEEEVEDDSTEDQSTEEETVADESIISDFRNQLGYEIEGEFEDTEEGLFEFVQKAIEVASETKFESTIEQFPEVKQFHNFLLNGGNPNEYLSTQFAETDYSTIEIDNNEDAQERIVRIQLKEQGVPDDKINGLVNKYKSSGMLEDQATIAKDVLVNNQKTRKETQLREQERLAQEQKEQAQSYWKEIEKEIKQSKEFSGITIKESEKDDFYKYIHDPVENGMTKRDMDSQKLDKEQLLAIDFLLFKGFDLAGLIDRKASSKKAKSLKERLNKGSRNLTGSSAERQSVEEIDYEALADVF